MCVFFNDDVYKSLLSIFVVVGVVFLSLKENRERERLKGIKERRIHIFCGLMMMKVIRSSREKLVGVKSIENRKKNKIIRTRRESFSSRVTDFLAATKKKRMLRK